MSLREIRACYFAGRAAIPPAGIRRALTTDPRHGARRLAEMASQRLARLRRLRRHTHRLLRHEQALWKGGVERIAGVDEAGVGPLAGPVVAAAVVLPPGARVPGLDDSKKLSEKQRDRLYLRIREIAVAVGVGIAEAGEIDRVNIFQAGRLAMRRAVEALPEPPEHLLVDARHVPGFAGPQENIVRGDSRCASIAAASVIAKVTRDRIMRDYDQLYPGYGFARHKGYGTAAHRRALRLMGRSPIHRKSFVIKEINGLQGDLFRASDGA
jgi:ribonuclease HII